MTVPCYKCQDRSEGCHTYCHRYLAYKEEAAAAGDKKKAKNNYEIHSMEISRAIRIEKLRRKTKH